MTSALTSAQLRIDLSAVAHNVTVLRQRSGADGLYAVVKADGFGHGAQALARTAVAHGATGLGVTSLYEAAPLLDAGVPVLSWLNPVGAAFDDPATARVQVAVPSIEHLDAVAAGAVRTGVRRTVHLFLDTGMSRDGCPIEEWAALCLRARRAERAGQVRVAGVMGHLGCAGDAHDPHHWRAVRRFDRAVGTARTAYLTPTVRHLSSTAAALHAPATSMDAVRVGAGLVGIDPSGRGGGLRQAATLTAPVIQVRRVRAGQAVGYGHDHVAARAGWLGLLPVGYADGVPRAATGRASVLVRGVRRPLVGWVSMDQVVVDLGDAPVTVGETAVVFGPGTYGEPTLADWAGWSGTIEHEVVTRVSARVPRRYVDEPRTVLSGAAA